MSKEQPKIRVQFELDEYGCPKFIESGDYQHFKIRLSIDNAPKNTYAVTYLLHESYYEPVREVRDNKNDFEETTTSYGNYTLKARIRSTNEVQTLQVDLSDALEKEYSDSKNPKVDEAIELIRKH